MPVTQPYFPRAPRMFIHSISTNVGIVIVWNVGARKIQQTTKKIDAELTFENSSFIFWMIQGMADAGLCRLENIDWQSVPYSFDEKSLTLVGGQLFLTSHPIRKML